MADDRRTRSATLPSAPPGLGRGITRSRLARVDLSAGDIFAGHRIEGVAGRGGMGVVYRATQLDLDRPVALKLIAPELSEDEGFRERFVRESRIAAAIDHPHVIPIYYAGEEDGTLYLAMRYVDGEDLRAIVRRDGMLEPQRAAQIVSQIGGALDAAHARGLVHRDVKPANVLLTARRPRLPDRLRPLKAGVRHERPDPRGPVGGHARLRRTRADPRPARRRADRRLRARLRPVLRAQRRDAVSARVRRGDAVGAPQRPAGAGRRARTGRPARVRRGSEPRTGQGPRRPLPVDR